MSDYPVFTTNLLLITFPDPPDFGELALVATLINAQEATPSASPFSYFYGCDDGNDVWRAPGRLQGK
jgi:hypothetical protein